MMGHIWSVYLYELKRNATRKGFLFTTFGVPLIGFIILIAIQTFSGSSADDVAADLDFDVTGIDRAGYVDHSGEFPQPGPYVASIMTRYDTEDAAQAALDAGEIEVYYIIAEDYLDTAAVTLVVPQFAMNLIINARNPFEALLFGQYSDQVDTPMLLRLRTPSLLEQVKLSEETGDGTERNEDTDFALVYGFGLIFLLSIFGTNGYLMQSVIEEKESSLIEILIASVRPGQLLAGKIFAMGTLGMFQVVAYITAAYVLTQYAATQSELVDTMIGGIELPLDKLPVLAVYFVLSYLFFAAGFGAVGALSNSMQEGPNLALIFTLPAIAPFYFMPLFISDPNGTLPVALSLFPITAPMSMVMRLSVSSVPIYQLAISLGVLALMDWAMIWFAGRLFRMQTLLSGQMPKLRELPMLLRG